MLRDQLFKVPVMLLLLVSNNCNCQVPTAVFADESCQRFLRLESAGKRRHRSVGGSVMLDGGSVVKDGVEEVLSGNSGAVGGRPGNVLEQQNLVARGTDQVRREVAGGTVLDIHRYA